MPWIIPENKLDADQRSFINNVDITKQNIFIKGFAGSGKSVLLAYVAKKVLSSRSKPSVVLIVFTQSLVTMYKTAFNEMGLNVDVRTYYSFLLSNNMFDYILCDEVQDLPARVLREMNKRGKHVIVAGDSNQSIYDCDPKYQEKTVEPSEIINFLLARAFELTIIHRLSRSIIDAVQRFMPKMNIFSSKRDLTKGDTQIRLCEAPSDLEEVSYVMKKAKEAISKGYTAAILIPEQKMIVKFIDYALQDAEKDPWKIQLNKYGKPDMLKLNNYLLKCGLKIQFVGSGIGNFSESDDKITIMTMHSSKGLDFDQVFIPFANASMSMEYWPDPKIAQTVFMVAMTRSRGDLYITYHGYKSHYLDAFEKNCLKIDISDTTTQPKSSKSINIDNPWGF